ncbi:hypothetical protein EUGRSUZ_G01702 [Eucalyptus grandis]|uniref:Uncharacterized protein n=2 Tax=Eucalyptus grandis TaxID=71139 RepID=A0ACC3K3U2_EUCGR|nr:hypothetical protein EUGRSUZ_G01702 [Eucalyptus grandis]
MSCIMCSNPFLVGERVYDGTNVFGCSRFGLLSLAPPSLSLPSTTYTRRSQISYPRVRNDQLAVVTQPPKGGGGAQAKATVARWSWDPCKDSLFLMSFILSS